MKKILIVEDDKFLANAYRIKFSEKGFDIQIARNGNDVLEFLRNFIPDIILLDLVLPGENGFTLLKQLKNNKKWKDIPVIVASNLGQEEDIKEAINLGAEKYLLKAEHSLEEIIEITESAIQNV